MGHYILYIYLFYVYICEGERIEYTAHAHTCIYPPDFNFVSAVSSIPVVGFGESVYVLV